MSNNGTTLPSLRVDPALARRFRIEAVNRGMRRNEPFEEIVLTCIEDATRDGDGRSDV